MFGECVRFVSRVDHRLQADAVDGPHKVLQATTVASAVALNDHVLEQQQSNGGAYLEAVQRAYLGHASTHRHNLHGTAEMAAADNLEDIVNAATLCGVEHRLHPVVAATVDAVLGAQHPRTVEFVRAGFQITVAPWGFAI